MAQVSEPILPETIDTSTYFGFLDGAPRLPELDEAARSLAYTMFSRGYEAQSLRLLDSLHTALSSRPELSPVALAYVKLSLARSLERRDELPRATVLTEELLRLPEIDEHPRLLAETYLLTELIHEKLGQTPEAIGALQRAREVIGYARLDSVAPLYYVRAASFERIYGSEEKARLNVDSALATAASVASYDVLADALFLHARLHRNDIGYEPVTKLREAAAIELRIGNFTSYGYRYINIASEYYRQGKTQAALSTLDTATALWAEAEARGYFVEPMRFSIYAMRAEIAHKQGQLDTAYHYLKLSKSLELSYAYDRQGQEVLRFQQAAARLQAQQEIESRNSIISLERTRGKQLVAAAISLAVLGFGLAVLSVNLNRAKKNIAKKVEHEAVLRDELQHRVKNNFQILISLLELQSEQARSPEVSEAFTAMAQRVYNLAAIHALLYDQSDQHLPNLQEYISHLVEKFKGFSSSLAPLRIVSKVEEVTIGSNQFMAFGIIINELLTNSAKHGTPPDFAGEILVEIEILEKDSNIVLDYRDNGGGINPAKQQFQENASGGLGTYLITSMVRQLRGRQSFDSLDGQGFRMTATIPTPKSSKAS